MPTIDASVVELAGLVVNGGILIVLATIRADMRHHWKNIESLWAAVKELRDRHHA